MGVRLPTILGKAIDDVVKTLNEQVCVSFLNERLSEQRPSQDIQREVHVLTYTALVLYQSISFNTPSHARMHACTPSHVPAKSIKPHQSDEDIMIDLVQCIERMEDLMEDLQKNRKLGGSFQH
jgi:hypothetical protein